MVAGGASATHDTSHANELLRGTGALTPEVRSRRCTQTSADERESIIAALLAKSHERVETRRSGFRLLQLACVYLC